MAATFGDDASDKYWDESDGQGSFERQADGSYEHTDFRGNTEKVAPDVVETFLDQGETADAV